MKTQTEWVDLVMNVFMEERRYRKEEFEEIVGDKFEAVKLDERERPVLIWTTNYVCPVKFEMMEDELPVMKIKRNP